MKKITMALAFMLVSFAAFAQFPENFDNSVPPSGWTIFLGTNGLGTIENWGEFNDEAAVFPENVSGGNAQDWLVTPQFTPSASANILTFDQRQSNPSFNGSVYTIRISTASQTDPNDFVIVDTQTEGGFGTSYSEHTVDLSAYNGTPIYIAFVMEQDDGDSWFIDNLDMVDSVTPANPFPEDFTNTSVSPAGWITYTGTNGLGTIENWSEFNDEAAVFPENVSGGNAQDWLVTPQFTPSASANILTFDQRQSNPSFNGSVYTIRVSIASQTDPNDFVIVDTQTEGGFGTSYSEHTVDLSAYNGTPIYIAFVMEQDDGDSWFIDNLDMVDSVTPANPFPEDFTNTSVPPAGWITYTGTNGLGTIENWSEFNDEAAVFPENVSGGNAQDWLVTPQFTPSASANILTFDQRQSNPSFNGSVYTIRISTASQTDPNDFVIIDTQTEGGFGTSYSEHTVDLSAYNGTPIYIAFVMEQDDGDSWFIDNLDMTDSTTPGSPFPEDFTNTSVPPTGWIAYTGTNGLGTSESWGEFNDEAAVFPENVSGGNAQDWLVTPQFTPSASANILTFDQRQSNPSFNGSVYTIRISTASQTDPNDFVIVDTQTEGGFGTSYSEHTVDLSTYNGTPIYIAFVMEQDDGDSWFIDNLDMVDSITPVNPFPEDFTNTSVPPAGWITYTGTNGLGTIENWGEFNDEAAVFPENVSGGNAQDWLVTPQFTPSTSANILTFDQRQSNPSFDGSTYTIRISIASQTDPNDFAIVDTQTEGGFGTTYSEHTVDLSAYNGTPIYIAFVMEQDDGDSWFIDNLDMASSSGVPGIISEDFEDAIPPTGWTAYRGSNGEGVNSDWTVSNDAHAGSQAAYIEFENVPNEAEDWLVTPQFTPTGATNVLSFYQKQSYGTDYNTEYTIRVSATDQTTISSFIIVDTQSETDFSTSYTEHQVDLSQFNGIPIYVAFVMTQDDGDDWFIDSLDLIPASSPPNCPELAFSPMNNANDIFISFDNTIELDWFEPDSGFGPEGYEIFFGTQSGNLTSLGTTNDSFAIITGINYNTTYYWRIVPFNVAGSASGCDEYSFTTESNPTGIVPYYEDDFAIPLNDWEIGVGDYATIPSIYHFNNSASLIRFEPFAHASGGSQSIVFNIWDQNTRDYFISSKFDLSATTYYLNFDIALTEYNTTTPTTLGTNDYVALLVTEDNGLSWTELNRWDSNSSISNSGEAAAEIGLSGYGNNVYFAFYAFSGAENLDIDFFLDNFRISDTTASTNDEITSNIAVFPTLVDNEMNINADEKVDEVQVYNLLGQQVFSSQPKLNNSSIDLSNLKAGIYIVKVRIGNASNTYKIIKK